MSTGVTKRNSSAYESARSHPGLADNWHEKRQKSALEHANERFVARIHALCTREGWRV